MHHQSPPNIVLIHGVPRSGTSWLGQIFNAHEDVAFRYQPLFSHTFKDRLGPDTSPAELQSFFDDIASTDDPFVLARSSEVHGSYPVFEKNDPPSHLVVKHVRYHHLVPRWMESRIDLKVVVLVRHPCAAMLSWLNAPREFLPQWDPVGEWRLAPSKNQGRPEEFNGFERWKDAARLFLRLSREWPDRCRIQRYGDLIADPEGVAETLFEWVDLRPTTQSRAFIRDSTSKNDVDPYAVYKTKVDDQRWKHDLNPTIADAILSELEGTELEQFLQ